MLAGVIDLVSDDEGADGAHARVPVTPSPAPIIEAAIANANASERGKLALLMQPQWLDRLLHYGKIWEIRGRDTKVRDKIYLARKNRIYGETYITDSFAVTKPQLEAPSARACHHVADLSIVAYKTPFVWKVAQTKIYARPVTFTRKKGQVIWCKVDFGQLRGDSIEERMYLCCDTSVDGAVIACAVCGGLWHVHCLRHLYRMGEAWLYGTQSGDELFVCCE
jgi:hypothetical protein